MSTELLQRIASEVGPNACLTGPDAEPYAVDWRRRYFGRPLAVVRPASTEQVSAVVRLCAQSRVSMVPQGGNTGLCGGATPDASGRAVVLNLSRMNRVRALDALNNTITVESGNAIDMFLFKGSYDYANAATVGTILLGIVAILIIPYLVHMSRSDS